MTSAADTPEAYIAELPEERKEPISRIRDLINAHLPAGFEEGMVYGMISWHVPHSIYPAGYHCDKTKPVPFIALASQKQHMSLYLSCIYGNAGLAEWFVSEYEKTGQKMDMGKCCVRFRKIENCPLHLIPELLSKITAESYIAEYEAAIPPSKSKKKG